MSEENNLDLVSLNGPRRFNWLNCFSSTVFLNSLMTIRWSHIYMASSFCRLQRFISSPSKIDRAYQSTMSVCPSVCLSVPPPNSFQTQHIDLKLSTLLFDAKSGAKFKDGQNRTKFYSCHGYLIENKVGSMGQKNYFVRMTRNLVHLYICWLKMISEKIIKFGWKMKKL